MSAPSIRRFVIGLRARYHLWSGRRAYRAGRIRVAGRHLDEAISCGHESFDAHLLLGKIAYRERDLARAAEHFHRARDADPGRYGMEGFPEGFLRTLRRQPASVARLQYRIVIEPQLAPRTGRSAPVVAPAEESASGRSKLGDFTSKSEWMKHRDLPAFRPGEGSDVNWDDEARKLFDD